MQKWKREGLIFQPKKSALSSHCQVAVPYHLSDGIYRIFYGSRNNQNYTQTFYFDYDLNKLKVVDCPEEPVLTLGNPGCFDEHGIYPSSIVKIQDEILMYTIGYAKGYNGMFYMRIGLAKSRDLKKFEKYSSAPVMNTSEYDPWILTAPCVIYDNNRFRMWYVSGKKCERINDNLKSFYHIKYAESQDGVNWKREGIVSVDYVHPNETNIARPWVIKEDEVYKVWYSYCCEGSGYRIGYAESSDGGYTFERRDHLAGINPSSEPWENHAVAYPSVVVHEGKKYMFYNGNNFGKDGIALAVSQ